MDKDNESYLDNLLEEFGQEPPNKDNRRQRAKVAPSDDNMKPLNESFKLDDTDALVDAPEVDTAKAEIANSTESVAPEVSSDGEILADGEISVNDEVSSETSKSEETGEGEVEVLSDGEILANGEISVNDEVSPETSKPEETGEGEIEVSSDGEILADGEIFVNDEVSPETSKPEETGEGEVEVLSDGEILANGEISVNDEVSPETSKPEETGEGEIEVSSDGEIPVDGEISADGEITDEVGIPESDSIGESEETEESEKTDDIDELLNSVGIDITDDAETPDKAETQERAGTQSSEENIGDVSENNQDSASSQETLDDLGTPEILSEKEIEKSKKKKDKDKKDKDKKGGFKALFHKLFDNIPLTEEEVAAIPTPEEEEAAKKAKAEEEAKKKEEKKAAAAEAKKQKAEAKKQKKAAQEAKKKERELKRLRAEALEPPEGKINKAGAIVVFLFFMVAASVVIVGTNIFSYDISIANATYRFGKHHYTEAYNGIRGLEIRQKDMELHDKIYTVMFVNKQLNSYNNFFAMGDYPNALNSLIKGLSRYDKYIALASQLGIHSDLNYVRKQIMSELSKVYGISERDALVLMNISDKQEYSEKIYSMVSKLDIKALNKQREKENAPAELVP